MHGCVLSKVQGLGYTLWKYVCDRLTNWQNDSESTERCTIKVGIVKISMDSVCRKNKNTPTHIEYFDV